MSISSEITRIKNNISSAYNACNSKGATMPSAQNSANLSDCINSISVSVPATLTTKTIVSNGTYNASFDNADGYSSVTVEVATADLTTLSVNQNGVYNAQDYDKAGFSQVTVNVPEGILEGLMSEIVAGNNPVSTTDLASIEANITAMVSQSNN